MTVSIDINIHIHHHNKEEAQVRVGGESIEGNKEAFPIGESISGNDQVMPAGEVVTAGDITSTTTNPPVVEYEDTKVDFLGIEGARRKVIDYDDVQVMEEQKEKPPEEPEHPPAASTLLKETAFDEHNNLKTDAQLAKTRLYSDPLIEESRKMREETVSTVSIVSSHDDLTPTYNS